MEKIVKVKSSSSTEIYDVILKNENGIISLNCTCQAGIYKMICKHRTDLLNGNISSLVDESDIPVVEEFLNSIKDGKIDSLFAELTEIEKEIKKLNNKKKKIKKDISIRFCDGF